MVEFKEIVSAYRQYFYYKIERLSVQFYYRVGCKAMSDGRRS